MADCAAMSDAVPALQANDYRDTWCGQVLADRVDSDARLAGWVHRRRDHGGLVFVDLRDRTGLVQLVFHPDDSGEAFELAHRLRPEDVLTVSGPVVRRDPETVNAELPTGEFELRVRDATLLSHAETPPFEIESFSGEVGEEMRLRYRYLDLRRERMAQAIVKRHAVSAAIREFLDGEGFLDIETPMLTRSTPEGARDFLVPSRREPGSFYALPQSPQLFKQLLMVAGFERYFQIVRCFRDEDQRADRQPDFTQLDIEMSFVGVEDVLDLNERLLAFVFDRVGGPSLELPLPRLAYDEAMARFGTDRPDLRFGLELTELTDLLAATEFKVFRGVIESRRRRQGSQRRRSRRARARFSTGCIGRAQELGAKGLVWAFREGDGWRSPTAKFLSDAELAALNDRLARRGGRPAARGRRPPGGGDRRARPAPARPRRALRADRSRGRGVLLGGRLADVRLERRRGSVGPAAPSVHRPGRDLRPEQSPARRARWPTTSSGTARSWAAARSGSRTRSCSSRCWRRSGSRRTRRASASASCSRRCATARRRTAGSPTGSTGSSSGSCTRTRFAT